MTPLHVKIAGWAVILAASSIVALWMVVFLAFWAVGKAVQAAADAARYHGALGPAVAFAGCIWLALRGLH